MHAEDSVNRSAIAPVSRGSAFLRLNRLKEALADFNHAIDIDPDYARAFHLRGFVEDIAMVQHLTNKNIETFANENNVWRSQHLRLESMMENELGR
jgi:Tfp pilus assembly protein PilF